MTRVFFIQQMGHYYAALLNLPQALSCFHSDLEHLKDFGGRRALHRVGIRAFPDDFPKLRKDEEECGLYYLSVLQFMVINYL